MAHPRRAIWLKTLTTVAVFVGITLGTETVLLPGLAGAYAVRLAVAFALTQLVAIGALVGLLLVRKSVSQSRLHRFHRAAPATRRAIVAHVLAAGDWSDLRRQRERDPGSFERCVIDLLGSLEGSPRERLAELAIELGLVDDWLRDADSPNAVRRVQAIRGLGFTNTPMARRALVEALGALDSDTRQAAAHALVRHGDQTDIERVFDYAVSQPLWDRAVLGDALVQHVELLGDRAIPMALRRLPSHSPAGALELVQSWNVRLPFDVVAPLLDDPDPVVRTHAFRLLSKVPDQDGLDQVVRSGLVDAHDDVRAAAAFAAHRLKLFPVAPALAACASGSGEHAPLAAAMALAGLGRPGLEVLEALAMGESDAVAVSATEVIEKARLGRLQPVAG